MTLNLAKESKSYTANEHPAIRVKLAVQIIPIGAHHVVAGAMLECDKCRAKATIIQKFSLVAL